MQLLLVDFALVLFSVVSRSNMCVFINYIILLFLWMQNNVMWALWNTNSCIKSLHALAYSSRKHCVALCIFFYLQLRVYVHCLRERYSSLWSRSFHTTHHKTLLCLHRANTGWVDVHPCLASVLLKVNPFQKQRCYVQYALDLRLLSIFCSKQTCVEVYYLKDSPTGIIFLEPDIVKYFNVSDKHATLNSQTFSCTCKGWFFSACTIM